MADWLLWNFVYMPYEVWLFNWGLIFAIGLLFGLVVLNYIKIKRIENQLKELI